MDKVVVWFVLLVATTILPVLSGDGKAMVLIVKAARSTPYLSTYFADQCCQAEGSMVVNDSSKVDLLPFSSGISKQIQGTHFGKPLTFLLDLGSTTRWTNKQCLPKGIQGYMVEKVAGSTRAGTFASTE